MSFLHIKIDSEAVQKAIRQAPESALQRIHNALQETAVESQRFYRQNMPTGVTGFLRRSVHFAFQNRVTVKVEPSAPYADYVESGTRPHWTSVHNLERWANLRGINPYALQHSIASHGTKAHPYQDKTYKQTARYADIVFHGEMSDFVRRFNQ